MAPDKVLYVAHSTATGGRDGKALSSDGILDVKLTTPKELGGGGGDGTNPEQLFAAGYAACFIGAMKFAAMRDKIAISKDVSVEGVVGVGPTATGFAITVELKVSLPGMDKAVAQDLINRGHVVCPYSNATRGNVDVKLTLV
ncbi:organic hydroperoxide resistance protein [Pseudomonas sp. NA-150]|uniref:organic hydroperoxide resistance protein n=1 Tax=Pseudomonas sp. NA-150 TaxID=3367525 RepID=UPI0037C6BE7A